MLKAVEAPEQWNTFDNFWALYPRRVARKDSEKAWMRLDEKQRADAIEALVAWRKIWAQKEIQYIPHASTWLNGERFYDELPTNNTPTHASHVPAKPHLESERGEMPESVKAAIAKVRAR
jgi:DNA replication protein DnaC